MSVIEWFQLEPRYTRIENILNALLARTYLPSIQQMLNLTQRQAKFYDFCLHEIYKYHTFIQNIEPSQITRTIALRVADKRIYWSTSEDALSHPETTYFIITGRKLRAVNWYIKSDHPNWYFGAISKFTCRELRAIQAVYPNITAFYINLRKSPSLKKEIEELYHRQYAVKISVDDSYLVCYTSIIYDIPFDDAGKYVAFVPTDVARAYELLLEIM